MKRALILSFDLIGPDEPSQSLSIATFTTYARSREELGRRVDLHHLSFNLVERRELTVDDVIATVAGKFALASLDLLAISCYVWCEYLVNPLIAGLRREGFGGVVILGGYQVQYSDSPEADYPDCQVFIKGYAEASFVKALEVGVRDRVLVLHEEPDFDALPSPYLQKDIAPIPPRGKVRMESKRGCPYRCAFCAHRDLVSNRVHRHPSQRALDELALFEEARVQKVNMVDPVFNTGPDYLEILQTLVERQPSFLLSLQTRFECIRGERGERFLHLCERLNVCLEFGLQTVNREESSAIGRTNDEKQISEILFSLNDRGIPYEVSLIYGLPHQTVASFQRSIAFLEKHHCPIIKAFPLMLLRGTELCAQKHRWGLREAPIGDYHIPVVIASSSFSEPEWHEMRSLASSLSPVERY